KMKEESEGLGSNVPMKRKRGRPSKVVSGVEGTDMADNCDHGMPKELTTVYKLNELIPDEPKRSIIEIKQIHVSAEHEFMPSEQINNTVFPETGTQDTKTVDTENSCTGVQPLFNTNCSSFGAVNNVDANQPTEVLIRCLLNNAVGKDGEGSL
ncbi:hypothetical protein CR513_39036, partial [Mucuna pruriens]